MNLTWPPIIELPIQPPKYSAQVVKISSIAVHQAKESYESWLPCLRKRKPVGLYPGIFLQQKPGPPISSSHPPPLPRVMHQRPVLGTSLAPVLSACIAYAHTPCPENLRRWIEDQSSIFIWSASFSDALQTPARGGSATAVFQSFLTLTFQNPWERFLLRSTEWSINHPETRTLLRRAPATSCCCCFSVGFHFNPTQRRLFKCLPSSILNRTNFLHLKLLSAPTGFFI